MAVVLGVVSSLLALLSMHYFNYQRFLHKDREELLKAAALIDELPAGMKQDGKLAEALAEVKQAKAVDSFPSYLNYEATQGVTISSRGRNGFNLGYVGTCIYWGLEWIAVAAMATFGMVGGAAAPFCSTCNQWKEERQLGTLEGIGGAVADVLRDGQVVRLKEHKPAPQGGTLVLTAAVCPNCKADSPIAVKLEELTKNDKGEEEKAELIHLVYPGEALVHFESVFTAPKRAEQRDLISPAKAR